ncbi:MAG TPA: rod shape-determining protein RodA [Thermoanaerobaculia bacterium]|jgi:rod shape determining protein RodA|nr:rod shape-determining protein RodA [Thermoanaerobaculia bacterium]
MPPLRDRVLPTLDLNFLGTALVIAAVGCLAIYSATYFWDPSLSILKKQFLWVGIGLALMLIFLVVDYHIFFDIAPILYGIGMILLLYLLLFGKLTAKVKSWIHIGGFQFQPSEFMKIFTALLLAKFFDSNDRAYLNFRSFVIAMLIIGAPVGLIIIQPDFGTAATFFPLVGVAMFFGGIRLRVWIAMILIVAIALPLGWMFFLKPYQKERVMIFLNPERDPLGSGYQVTQAKIAIGSGGVHGKGFMQGTQAKLEFLPARHTDFIFAVLGEEWGFIGVVIVLGLYLFLIWQALTFAKNARDRGGTFLAISLISFFIFHIFINVAMQIGVLPTTGIPLPLISYGGSSAMMFFIAIGLLLNVDMRRFVNA